MKAFGFAFDRQAAGSVTGRTTATLTDGSDNGPAGGGTARPPGAGPGCNPLGSEPTGGDHQGAQGGFPTPAGMVGGGLGPAEPRQASGRFPAGDSDTPGPGLQL